MAHYSLESEWKVTAPIDRVFDLLNRPDGYGDWWPAIESSRRLEEGDHSGVGATVEYMLRSPLIHPRFTATVVEAERPHLIRGLIRGDFVGTATFRLHQDHGTNVRLLWRVATTRPSMHRLASVFRPIFIKANNQIIEEGAAGMAARLGAQLISMHIGVDAASPHEQRTEVSP